MGLLSGFEHIARDNEPLAPYTWMRLGGAAEYFAEPTSIDELGALVRRCREAGVSVKLLGGGSNLLIRDEGVRGMVIHLSAPAFCDISIQGQTITAGGAAKLAHVISTSAREGLAGLETLVGIPGTVGGALHGNSGTESGDIGQWADAATVMLHSGEIVVHERQKLRFGYRQSSLDELVILSARFALEKENPETLTKRLQKVWILKKASQPASNVTAGCVFKSPIGASAASLIEQAGLKGSRVGMAEVSAQNANFVVANPGARSADVLELIDHIRKQVEKRLGVELETQLEVW